MFKVLIAEDEDAIRRGLVHTINWIDMGCDVVASARNGAEGLQMIRAHTPDIVLADIKMPHMNGFEMIEAALKECFFKAVILTSYSEFAYAKRAIGLQVSDYLLKPVDENILRKVIARICGELNVHYHYSEIAEKIKASPVGELERWDIYQSQHAPRNIYVKKAVQKIVDHYQEKISIEIIAKEMGVSGSYLSRKFKEYFGKSYLEALNQYRIQQSIRLLGEGTYRVYEVAFLCGFNEYKHFCTVFKRYTDMSPNQFMKSCGHTVTQHTQSEPN